MLRTEFRHFTSITIALTLLGLCVASCGLQKTGKFKFPESGQYYELSFNGGKYIVFLESSNGDSASGFYYSCIEGPVAPRHGFSAGITRRSLILDTEGSTQKMNWKEIRFKAFTQPEFEEADTRPFRERYSSFEEIPDLIYGNAKGYWTSLQGVEAEVSKAFTEGYIKSFKRRNLDLTLDLYLPDEPEGKKPLILFLHGGAFYVGDKREPAYLDFCRYFSSMGYITASMNYRMGFHLGKGEIERAGYTALQDAHAAMRFLISKADEYGIDTDRIFVAGSSAGSITALNLAFMTEKDRPASSFGGKGLFNGTDMGSIDGSGNDIKASFKIRAVANMWGAVSSIDILSNSGTDIISFHGDVDEIVPFGEGYPFSKAGENISKMLSEKMYGSASIHEAAEANGLVSSFYPFPGEGHALNTSGKDKQPNDNHIFIREKMAGFFYREIVPKDASIVDEGNGRYRLEGDVESVSWKAEGGFILETDGNEVTVLWQEDAPSGTLTASGRYPGGPGYLISIDLF